MLNFFKLLLVIVNDIGKGMELHFITNKFVFYFIYGCYVGLWPEQHFSH